MDLAATFYYQMYLEHENVNHHKRYKCRSNDLADLKQLSGFFQHFLERKRPPSREQFDVLCQGNLITLPESVFDNPPRSTSE